MKILLVADQPGWIFDRHCHEIQSRISKYEIDIAYRRDGIKELSKKYDLVYVLDPIPLSGGYPPKEKTIMGLRCEFLYREHPQGAKGLYDKGFPGRCESIKDKCCIFHVVNKRLMEEFREIVVDKPLLLVQHGVNTDVFSLKKSDRSFKLNVDKIRVSVSGRNSNNKGFNLVEKACEKAGVKITQAEYNRKLSYEEMPSFYSKSDIHVCMSKDEGLNNPLMEAGAMGLAPISTISGAADEMIRHNDNGILIERSVDALVEAIEKLKDDSTRIWMAKKYYFDIHSNWSWDVKIKEYEAMFDFYFEGLK